MAKAFTVLPVFIALSVIADIYHLAAKLLITFSRLLQARQHYLKSVFPSILPAMSVPSLQKF
ncbi:hypothetical protein [uncultured Phascolarctobacterium sp.]|uniref:hypothetical protein n=1 Tax=uncultured Phascolarctobacterium sp. TaxID=512296 RepID=UPI0025E15AC6|nr:hypothetical protein [uncultured Phascolarctobacterium sp.]